MTTHAYLIDPFACEVRHVELVDDPDSDEGLHAIYALLDCAIIEAVVPESAGTDVLYVDEEGKAKEHACGFFCRLWPYEVLLGKALWIGSTVEGDTCAPSMPISYVRDHIIWS
jgi:hypothetical protein